MNFVIFTVILCLISVFKVCDGGNYGLPSLAQFLDKDFCETKFLTKCDNEWTSLAVIIKII